MLIQSGSLLGVTLAHSFCNFQQLPSFALFEVDFKRGVVIYSLGITCCLATFVLVEDEGVFVAC